MNEMIKKGVVAGVLVTTITGTGIYLYGMNRDIGEIRKTTIINQENKIRIDYKQIILDELIEQKQIIIASNKMRIPFTQTEKHWWGSKTQEIEFSAIGRFVVDLDKLNSQDIMVDEESKTITIYMTKPTKIVELLEDETKFGETKKGLFVFGDIEYTLEEVETSLNKKSGVLGISGVSSDFRDIEKAVAEGNERAKLALDIFHYKIKGQIGAYIAQMGGVDAIIFTAGVGENGPESREACLSGLEFLGIKLDSEKNKSRGKLTEISAKDSKVKVYVIPTNEELMIAKETVNLLK